MRAFEDIPIRQKYYAALSFVLMFALIFSSQNYSIRAQKQKNAASAPSSILFQQCWELTTEGATKTPLASDNESQFFLSSQSGVVSAINLSDGNQNWKTELGGSIISAVYEDGVLYVVSYNQTDNTYNLRALSAVTGVTKWQKSLIVSRESDLDSSRVSLVRSDSFLVLVTGNGDLYKFAKDDGEEFEKVSLGEQVTTNAVLIDRKIIIGTGKKNLLTYQLTEKMMTKITLAGTPTILYADSERVVVGDSLGKLFSFKAKSSKKEWEARLGAEISEITGTDQGLLISSNDNFVYLVSSKNGEKIWKRRFANRTAAVVGKQPESPAVAVNLNSNVAVLLDPQTGRITSQITLSDSDFFTGKPLFANGRLIFKTNSGVVAYSTNNGCSKSKRPESNPVFENF